MRRYGLYDTTRGLTVAVAAGVAGLLLWLASQVGTQSEGRFWAAMAIVAAAGLVTALAHVVVGWTKGLRVRVSAGTFALAVLPTLVCVGWILLATQPGNGFAEARVDSWSHSIGLLNVIHALALWHGVLAFGFGLVLGRSFDTVPDVVVDAVPADEPVATAAAPPTADEPVAAEPEELAVGARRREPVQ
jgi:hypothetical protein